MTVFLSELHFLTDHSRITYSTVHVSLPFTQNTHQPITNDQTALPAYVVVLLDHVLLLLLILQMRNDSTHRAPIFSTFAGSQRFNIFPFDFPRVHQKLVLELLLPNNENFRR